VTSHSSRLSARASRSTRTTTRPDGQRRTSSGATTSATSCRSLRHLWL